MSQTGTGRQGDSEAFIRSVEELRQRESSPEAMGALLKHADAADDAGVASLARVLANSGTVVPLRNGSCDVASTGGPFSLSTLLSPLFLRQMGYIVPKVGVPGRPAGAVDVLATIPGYRVQLDHTEFATILAQTGFCHAIAGDDLAPLDRDLFAFRKQHGAVAVGPLVIASLLAKKIAVGIEHVVLEIRVWAHGNFGRNLGEARNNAVRFCRVAKLSGVLATCVLTDASRPYQPYIGRGESLLALEAALFGEAEPWLSGHVQLCHRIANEALASEANRAPLDGVSRLRHLFETHLTAQGSSLDAFRTRVAGIASEAATVVCANVDGFLAPDILALRDIIVGVQSRAASDDAYADPVGLRLLAEPDTFVRRGSPIARVRHGGRPEVNDGLVLPALVRALTIRSEPQPHGWSPEVVRSDAPYRSEL